MKAERAAELAAEAAKRTQSAADFGEYWFKEGSAKWWAMKANDAATRMCVTALPVFVRLPSGRMWPPYLNPGTPEYLQRKLREKACAGK